MAKKKLIDAFLDAIGKKDKESNRRINSANADYITAQAPENTLNSNNIAYKQTELQEDVPLEAGFKTIEENFQNSINPVETYSKTIKLQAIADETAGWRIEALFAQTPDSKGFPNYNISADEIPKSKAMQKEYADKINFTDKNHAYFNLAKMLTAVYTASDSSPLNNAVKDIIPKSINTENIPSTFVARQLLYETFSGKANDNMQKLLQPLIEETIKSTNHSISKFAENPQLMGAELKAGTTVLLNVLNSTTPDDFISQNGKWPIAAKCVKELVNIIDKMPQAVKNNPISDETMHEMRGWAKISDAVTNSAKAKQQLISLIEIPFEKKEQLWKDAALESKLRGLCANAYKLNFNINGSALSKNVSAADTFGKEAVAIGFAVKNKNAKALCLLGQNDELLNSIKSSIFVGQNQMNAKKSACAAWLVAHTEHNNTLNSDMIKDLMPRLNKIAPVRIKTEDERQLKSKKDMLMGPGL